MLKSKVRRPKFALFLLAFILFSSSVFGQTPTPTPSVEDNDPLKISTALIQADVTVTDQNGRLVTDLRPEELEVYENGKKRTITNFSFISIAKPAENTNSQPVGVNIPLPPVKLKAAQVRRTYALVVDDLGLNFGSLNRVRQTLRKFVDEQLQEGDLVAIIRTGAGIGATQSFTSDKRVLLAAIDKLRWNASGRSGIGSFTPLETSVKDDLEGTTRASGETHNTVGNAQDNAFQKDLDEFRNDNFSVGTLGALNYVIRGMQELPGRKAVLLFSEGLALMTDGKPNRILDAMRALADVANRASVVIYTIDPRGLQTPGMANADDKIRKILDDSTTRKLADREASFLESQQSLRYLANETGGVPYVNQNDIDAGLRQAVDDQSGYYLLGYEPDDETFDPQKNKFNKLEIKVTRPGIRIRYRSGFFGVSDEKIQSAPQTPQQKLNTALTSPFGANGINLSLYPVFQNDPKQGDLVQVLVYIDAKDLRFTPADVAGKRKANIDLIAVTFGDNGVQMDQFSKNYALEVTEKTYQNMLANGFVYTLTILIKKTGAYQLRLALRDTVSDKVGSASQFIEVPNIKKQLVLSNLVLDNFTPSEWQKIKLGGNRDESARSVLLDTTVRQYKRGTIVRYDYMIYNPKQSAELDTQLRLIKDGKVVYEEQPTAVDATGQPDLLRLSAAGAVSLGKNLALGNYVLQIIATDKTNAKKFATQYVEFEIVE
jgi:VWFA-related protein